MAFMSACFSTLPWRRLTVNFSGLKQILEEALQTSANLLLSGEEHGITQWLIGLFGLFTSNQETVK